MRVTRPRTNSMEIETAVAIFDSQEPGTSGFLTDFDSYEHSSQSEDRDPNQEPVENQLSSQKGGAKAFRKSEDTRDSMDTESIGASFSSQSGRASKETGQRNHFPFNDTCPEGQRENIERSLTKEINEIHIHNTLDLTRPAYQDQDFRMVIEKYVIPQICPKDSVLKNRRNDQYEKKFMMALNKKMKDNKKIIKDKSLKNSQNSKRSRVSPETETANENKKKYKNIYGFTSDRLRAFLTEPETLKAMTEEGLSTILFHLNKDTEDCVKVNLVEKLMRYLKVEDGQLSWKWAEMSELCKDKKEKKLPFFHVQNVICLEVAINKLLGCLNSPKDLSKLFPASNDSSVKNIEQPSEDDTQKMIKVLNKSKTWLTELKMKHHWADVDNTNNQPKLNTINQPMFNTSY